jgi:hypothetical protein
VRLTPAVRAIFALEIRTLLRDVRTLLISVVLPVVLIPGLLLATNAIEDRRVEREEARTFRLAIAGTDSTFARSLVSPLLERNGEGDAPPGRFRLLTVPDPAQALDREDGGPLPRGLHAGGMAVHGGHRRGGAPGGGAGPSPGRPGPPGPLPLQSNGVPGGSGDPSRPPPGGPGGRRDSILVAAGFPVDPGSVLAVERVDVASEGELQGARLGRFLTLIVLGLMLLGGSAVATDTLAGEKERGTLTTLLTSAATRNEIITAKLLAVMAVALAIALVQVVNLWVFVGLGVIDTGAAFAVPITTELAAGLFLLHLPVVALTAGVLLLTSAHARSYKEAQLYLTPVLLGMMLPALAPLLPDLSIRSAVVAVPIANLSLAVRDLLLGEMDIPFLALAWFVTAGAAAWVTRKSVEALQDESLLTGDTSREEFLGGPDLFRTPGPPMVPGVLGREGPVGLQPGLRRPPGDGAGERGPRLPGLPRPGHPAVPSGSPEALALRLPHPMAWAAVALGAPAGLFAAATIFRLADFVIPVPTELLENFGQQLLPEHIPLWQLVIFLAVVPGIAEELTFRGVLLHGLRRRFGPVGLSLVVGLIFGFFHFQIFRIPSTALLGVILTAVTLLTGSILHRLAHGQQRPGPDPGERRDGAHGRGVAPGGGRLRRAGGGLLDPLAVPDALP